MGVVDTAGEAAQAEAAGGEAVGEPDAIRRLWIALRLTVNPTGHFHPVAHAASAKPQGPMVGGGNAINPEPLLVAVLSTGVSPANHWIRRPSSLEAWLNQSKDAHGSD